jgi:hypothetical protein
MLTRQEMAEAARPLLRAMREHMPADFIDGPSEEVEITRSEGGTVVLFVKGLAFFLAANGMLTAMRKDEHGQAEYGGVDGDGAIRWGEAIVVLLPPPSMN